MNKIILFFIAALAMGAIYGEDSSSPPLKNAAWTEATPGGVPKDWAGVGPKGFCQIKAEGGGNALILKRINAGKPAMLIQRNLTIASGGKYLVSCEVKGSDGAVFLFYCEWKEKNASGKWIHRGFNTRKQDAPKEWTLTAFEVPVSGSEMAESLYLVMSAQSGEVMFRNLRMVESK